MIDDTSEWALSMTTFNGQRKRVVETIPDLFLVQQMLQFELKGNFDAVSSLLGFPLALKELEHLNKDGLVKEQKNKNILAFLSINPNIFKRQLDLQRFKEKWQD